MAELVGHILASGFVLHCCAVMSAIAAYTKSAAQRAGCNDWYLMVGVLLSFGPLLVPFQQAKVSNCLLKDETMQWYHCRHYVNGCAAHVGRCSNCPS